MERGRGGNGKDIPANNGDQLPRRKLEYLGDMDQFPARATSIPGLDAEKRGFVTRAARRHKNEGPLDE